MKKIDWTEYERRVSEFENQGIPRSDAQGIVDAQLLNEDTEVFSPFETYNS